MDRHAGSSGQQAIAPIGQSSSRKFHFIIKRRRRMKTKTALLGVLLSGSAAAFAQTNVTLYGVLDSGIEVLTNADAAGKRLVRQPGLTGEVPSAIGVRGVDDLGGGLQALFLLENGFNVKSGTINQGGRLFGRQAFVGITGAFGTLSFGRQYTMTVAALSSAEVMGPDAYAGESSFDTYIPNARSDNSVAYKGTFGAVTAGATYSLGRDASPAGGSNSPGQGTCAGEAAASATACRQWSAMLRYDKNGWGVASAYDEQRGGNPAALASFFNGAPAIGLASTHDKDVRMQLNGHGVFGALKFGGGWLGRRVRTAGPDVRADTYYLTAAYPVTARFVLDGGLYRMINRDQDTAGSISSIRGTYSFSRRTAVYAHLGYLVNSDKAQYSLSHSAPGGMPGKGMDQLGVLIGMRHSF
jgi:predicted porin